MLEILFIRHGQTDWNRQQRVMGTQPISLNEEGIRQAEKLAEYLKGTRLDAVVTSPVKRAAQTAQILLNDRPELKLIHEKRFGEIEYGEWVNLTFSDLSTKYSDIWRDYHQNPEKVKIPGGELLTNVRDRTKAAVSEFESKYPDGRIAVISHADVIKLAVIGVLDWPMNLFKCFSMDNGAMLLLRKHPTLGMRLVWFNHINGIGRDIRDGQ